MWGVNVTSFLGSLKLEIKVMFFSLFSCSFTFCFICFFCFLFFAKMWLFICFMSILVFILFFMFSFGFRCSFFSHCSFHFLADLDFGFHFLLHLLVHVHVSFYCQLFFPHLPGEGC